MTLATQFTGCWLFDDDDYTEDTTSTTAASTEVTTAEPSTEAPTEEPTDEPTEEPTEETTEETEAPTEETTDITTEPVSETTSVEKTTVATEETTEPTTGPSQGGPGGPPQQELNLDAEYDESKFLTYVDMPECKPDASVKESDFTGYWVCDVMAKGNVAYNAICDIPVYATGRLAINAHNAAFDEKGSGMFVNIKPVVVSDTAQGGPPQQAAAQQQATASEPEKTTLPLEYTFENGILMASVTIPVGRVNTGQFKDNQPNVMQQTPAIQGPPPKQMALQMTDDGRILVQTTGADGVVTSAYYKKVDQFEDFDWNSVHFDFESVYMTEAE